MPFFVGHQEKWKGMFTQLALWDLGGAVGVSGTFLRRRRHYVPLTFCKKVADTSGLPLNFCRKIADTGDT